MHKIIIQPGKYRGLYQIILLRRQRFFLLNWWKNISVKEYHEEHALLKFRELVQKLNIQMGNIYDWSEAELSKAAFKENFSEDQQQSFS